MTQETWGGVLVGVVAIVGGCADVSPSLTADDVLQLNADSRYAHDSSGNIIFGPTRIDQLVCGQRDAAGNVHADPVDLLASRASAIAQNDSRLAELARTRALDEQVRRMADDR